MLFQCSNQSRSQISPAAAAAAQNPQLTATLQGKGGWWVKPTTLVVSTPHTSSNLHLPTLPLLLLSTSALLKVPFLHSFILICPHTSHAHHLCFRYPPKRYFSRTWISKENTCVGEMTKFDEPITIIVSMEQSPQKERPKDLWKDWGHFQSNPLSALLLFFSFEVKMSFYIIICHLSQLLALTRHINPWGKSLHPPHLPHTGKQTTRIWNEGWQGVLGKPYFANSAFF